MALFQKSNNVTSTKYDSLFTTDANNNIILKSSALPNDVFDKSAFGTLIKSSSIPVSYSTASLNTTTNQLTITTNQLTATTNQLTTTTNQLTTTTNQLTTTTNQLSSSQTFLYNTLFNQDGNGVFDYNQIKNTLINIPNQDGTQTKGLITNTDYNNWTTKLDNINQDLKTSASPSFVGLTTSGTTNFNSTTNNFNQITVNNGNFNQITVNNGVGGTDSIMDIGTATGTSNTASGGYIRFRSNYLFENKILSAIISRPAGAGGNFIIRTSGNGTTVNDCLACRENQQVNVISATDSTSSTTGAFLVNGGIGCAKNIYCNGNIVIGSGSLSSTPFQRIINSSGSIEIGVALGALNFSNSAQAGDSVIRASTGKRLLLQGNSGGDAGIIIDASNNIFLPISTSKLGIGMTSTTNQLDLSTDDARKLTTNTWATVSDRRVKTNIQTSNYETCYNNIKQLELKRFTWNFPDQKIINVKEDEEGNKTEETIYKSVMDTITDKNVNGWIADEVEQVIPKAVNITDETERFNISDFKNVNADEIYKQLYGCVKHLINKVEILENKLKQLGL
jgi:hypothetical protein